MIRTSYENFKRQEDTTVDKARTTPAKAKRVVAEQRPFAVVIAQQNYDQKAEMCEIAMAR